MIKNLLFSLFFIILAVNVCAQDVHYYKLTRKKTASENTTSVTGGQFITFLSNICYESNNKGVGVDHGTLTLNNSYSNDVFSVYQGSSYWGNNTTFKFNSDKSVLNVVLENGDVYVYKRSTAPVGVTTCSLIRNNSHSSSSGVSVQQPNNSILQYPQQQYQQPQYQHPTYTPTSTPQPQTQREAKDCQRCWGSGKCQTCNGRGYYTALGVGSGTHDCPNCNKTGRCSSCGGSGKQR